MGASGTQKITMNEEQINSAIMKIAELPEKQKAYTSVEVIQKLEESIKGMINKNYSYSEIKFYLKTEFNLRYSVEELKIFSEEGFDKYLAFIKNKKEKSDLKKRNKITKEKNIK
jgi:hypothetical protein